jgi:hypothetical protein
MLKIIGAGLGRTGTSSTKIALERLGFGTCYHMRELMNHAVHLPYWQQALETGTTDWKALFEGYQAAVDYPSALFYQEQIRCFPDAKVLLTVRDPESWYESVLNTIYAVSRHRYRVAMSFLSRFVPPLREMYPRMVFVNELIWDGQFEGRFEDKDFAISKFIEWNETVKTTVPEDKLLVFEVKQGWQPLCEFLDVPVPDEPFPRANSRDEFRAMVQQNNPLKLLLKRGQ